MPPADRSASSTKAAPEASRLRSLRALVLDCDGVLTTGGLFYDESGRRLLRFDSKDGLGMAMLTKTEVKLAILSGRSVDIATQRFRELGVAHLRGRCRDKAEGVIELCAALNIAPSACAFVGDDLPDLRAFARVGLKIAVADAAPELHAAADWVTRARGGRGAVREICEAILKARGDWQRWLADVVT
ncbi:MAG: HAD hydrolase family protein [Myxococcota bacterium]